MLNNVKYLTLLNFICLYFFSWHAFVFMEEIWNLLLLGDISLLVLKIFEIPSFLWNRFEISNLSVKKK